MLQGESDCRSGSSGSAAANGIHDHQHGAAAGRQQAIHILRGSRLFNTVSSEILAHCCDKWFRVWHNLIVPPVSGTADNAALFR